MVKFDLVCIIIDEIDIKIKIKTTTRSFYSKNLSIFLP